MAAGRQTGPKRSPDQRESDLVEVARLYLQGHSQQEIAGRICQGRPYKLTQQAIHNDLETIRGRWLESSLVDFNEAKARELAKIDLLEHEYWAAWRQSKTGRKRESQEAGKSAKNGDSSKARITTDHTWGETRYLDGVRWCVEQRCKVLGLYDIEGGKALGAVGFLEACHKADLWFKANKDNPNAVPSSADPAVN